MSATPMRNVFWDQVYDYAKQDRNVMLVCADMGAPAIDKFRKDLPSQYINVGIAEQSMMSLAAGLAKEGKNVYTYAIAPFITSRAHEFTKLNAGLMKFPIKLVGVGAGFSYEDSGPTHHTTEDISIMRAIPNLDIYSPSDNASALGVARLAHASNRPAYFRLDRQLLPQIHSDSEDYSLGFRTLVEGKDDCIVSTGNMVHTALEVSKRALQLGKNVGVVDMYQLSPSPEKLLETLKGYKRVISLEEHLLAGGLGSILSESFTDAEVSVKLKRIGLSDYIYAYGGRENIQKVCGIDADSVLKKIL